MSTDLLLARHGGLDCPAGAFTIDPVRPAEVAVITHAHADHARPGSGVYHCTREGAAYTRARVGEDATIVKQRRNKKSRRPVGPAAFMCFRAL